MKETMRSARWQLIAASIAISCGGSTRGPVAPGSSIVCPDETKRVALDCSGEVDYQGRKVEAEMALKDIFTASGGTEDAALRDPSEKVQSYIIAHRRLCDQHNACMVPSDRYLEESRLLTQQLLMDLDPTGAQKAQLAEVHGQLGAEKLGSSPLVLTFKMKALIGGQELLVRPNMPVPTGAKVNFEVLVSRSAYVYMFQKTAADGVTALFPRTEIGLQNPLATGQAYAIPPREYGWYEVDPNDEGIENVYIIASPAPLQDVAAALEKMAKDGTKISDTPALAELSALDPGREQAGCRTRALQLTKATDGCTRSRGLVLVGGADNLAPTATPSASLRVQSDPGDPTIVKVFPWNHVKAAEYLQAVGAYEAPGEEGQRKRGILMEGPAN